MRRVTILIIAVLAWLLSVLSVSAQIPAWDVIAVSSGGDVPITLYRITPDAITPLAMPAIPPTLGARLRLRAISPDRSKAIVQANNRLFIMRLDEDTCCTPIEIDIGEREWGEDAGFHADNTRFAIAADAKGFDSTLRPRLIVIDTERVEVITNIEQGEPAHVRMRMGRWDGDAVLYMTVEYCTHICGEGAYTAGYLDASGGIAEEESPYQLVPFGTQLLTTREIVEARVSDAFPIDPEGPIAIPNTLWYQGAGEAVLIHYDPLKASMSLAIQWVADGQAVLTGDVLIWRSGKRERLDSRLTQDTIGTSDGWLTFSTDGVDDTHIWHVIAREDGLEIRDLGRLPGAASPLTAPLLGLSLGETPPPFAPLQNTDAVLACPDSLPPRLIVAQDGIVLADAPGLMRVTPSPEADVVMEMPAQTRFFVEDGPVCVDGDTWWAVKANGVGGWTIESGGGDYWLDFVPWR